MKHLFELTLFAEPMNGITSAYKLITAPNRKAENNIYISI